MMGPKFVSIVLLVYKLKLLFEPAPIYYYWGYRFFWLAVFTARAPPLERFRKSLITGSLVNKISASTGSSSSSEEKFNFWGGSYFVVALDPLLILKICGFAWLVFFYILDYVNDSFCFVPAWAIPISNSSELSESSSKPWCCSSSNAGKSKPWFCGGSLWREGGLTAN